MNTCKQWIYLLLADFFCSLQIFTKAITFIINCNHQIKSLWDGSSITEQKRIEVYLQDELRFYFIFWILILGNGTLFSFFHSLWIPWDPSELFWVSTARSFSPLSRVSPWEGCTSLFNCSPIGGHLGLLWHPCTCFCVDLGFHFFRMNAQGYRLQSHMVKCMCSLPKLFPQWHFDFSNMNEWTCAVDESHCSTLP